MSAEYLMYLNKTVIITVPHLV